MKKHFCKLSSILIVTLLGCNVRQFNNDSSNLLIWNVVNPKWDKTAEEKFSTWIEKIGSARAIGECKKLGDCLRNAHINSLYDERDNNINVFADCTNLPLILRAYFAYKTERPLIYMSAINGTQYSTGNTPIKWKTQKDILDIKRIFVTLSEAVNSGFYRMSPDTEKTDSYPIEINHNSMRPGSLFYDPNGHISIVYKIETNGIIRLLGGHPDNSLVVQSFGEKFTVGNAPQGGGFRNFRQYFQQADGSIIYVSNAESEGFSSTEQYKNTYSLEEEKTDTYYKWIRQKVALDGGKITPETEVKEKLQQLCSDISDRISTVQGGVDKGLAQQIHPTMLPENIYASSGDWNAYATASADASLKASFREIYNFIKESVVLLESKNTRLVYTENKINLIALYKQLLSDINKSCSLSYINSKGDTTHISLIDINSRLFNMSFDPYHCVELRWGAKINSPEYSTCNKDESKEKWFTDEYRIRNTIERQYSSPTPLTSGEETPPDINISKLLATL